MAMSRLASPPGAGVGEAALAAPAGGAGRATGGAEPLVVGPLGNGLATGGRPPLGMGRASGTEPAPLESFSAAAGAPPPPPAPPPPLPPPNRRSATAWARSAASGRSRILSFAV